MLQPLTEIAEEVGESTEMERLGPGFHEFYFHPGANKSRRRNDGLPDDGENRRIDYETLSDPRIIDRLRAPS